MEKAKTDIVQFLKQNAWGILVAVAVILSNISVMSYKTDEQNRVILDHEQRIRAIEIKQEMIMERLNNIQEDTRYLRQLFEERKVK